MVFEVSDCPRSIACGVMVSFRCNAFVKILFGKYTIYCDISYFVSIFFTVYV
jgi:hypothetical protein